MLRTRWTQAAALLISVTAGCQIDAEGGGTGGAGGGAGAEGTGGAPQGGGSAGGTPEGGAPEGGTPAGGAPEGGTPEGGTPEGGTPEGGTPEGGTPEGGVPQGGEGGGPDLPCAADGDCAEGSWCVEGACVLCGADRQIECEPGSTPVMRNGCVTGECTLENQCRADADCPDGQRCQAGPMCFDFCLAGDPACCEGNLCVPAEICPGPNPQGCREDADCPGSVCYPVDRCVPSHCECGEAGWVCTEDCGAGLCLPPACDGDADCAAGAEVCVEGQCAPCEQVLPLCDMVCPEGQHNVMRNGCETCACEPDAACPGPNPAGCASTGCPDGFACEQTDACIPSACGCDGEGWMCTADCGGGECVPVAPGCDNDGACPPNARCEAGRCVEVDACAGPSPAGCTADADCPEDEVCADVDACYSSGCDCWDGMWVCLPDCGGGACVPR